MQRFWQILRTIGVSILWLLDHAAPIIGRSLLWLLDRTGEVLWGAVYHIVQQTRRIAFGNWRRTAVTLLGTGLVAGRYWPQQVLPALHPLLSIAIVLAAIRIMFLWCWPLRRQRRQNNQGQNNH